MRFSHSFSLCWRKWWWNWWLRGLTHVDVFHSGSASEVPFAQLKCVCLDCECNSQVWLTLAARLVHARGQWSKEVLKAKFVQGVFRTHFCHRLFELRNGTPFTPKMVFYAMCLARTLHNLHCEVPSKFSSFFYAIPIQFGTFLINKKGYQCVHI